MTELFCAFSQEPRLRRGKVANARNLRSNAYNAVRRYGAFAPRFFYALGSAVCRYGAFAPRFFYALGSAVRRYGAFAPRFFYALGLAVCRYGAFCRKAAYGLRCSLCDTLKAIRRAAREYARGKGRQSRGGGRTRQTDSATFHAFQTTVRRLPTELQSPTRWTRPLFLAMGAGVYPTETITLSAGTRVILPSAARTSA